MDIDASTLSELEAIRQEHESFLTQLETYAVIGIATGDWNSFYELLVDYQNQHDLPHAIGVAIGEETDDPSNDSIQQDAIHLLVIGDGSDD